MHEYVGMKIKEHEGGVHSSTRHYRENERYVLAQGQEYEDL
jgi:hypothetical protein